MMQSFTYHHRQSEVPSSLLGRAVFQPPAWQKSSLPSPGSSFIWKERNGGRQKKPNKPKRNKKPYFVVPYDTATATVQTWAPSAPEEKLLQKAGRLTAVRWGAERLQSRPGASVPREVPTCTARPGRSGARGSPRFRVKQEQKLPSCSHSPGLICLYARRSELATQTLTVYLSPRKPAGYSTK